MNNVQKTRAEHARASQLRTCPARYQTTTADDDSLPAILPQETPMLTCLLLNMATFVLGFFCCAMFRSRPRDEDC
jgi:hypothetical protein